jgi:hypothetical protein
MLRRHALIFAAIWLPLLLWWGALLPGGLSSDTLDSWTQIHTGQWSSHHPPPFTAFLWLTSLGGTTPATTSLAQTALVAAALTFFAGVARHVLRTGRWVWVAAVLLGVLPLLGPFTITIWKDIPETAALIVLAGLIVLASHVTAPLPRRWWTALAVTAFVVGLLRWNGGPTALVAGVVVALALTGSRRWWAAVTVAAAGMAGMGILFLLPHVAPITPLQPLDTHAEQLADLSQWARNEPDAFSPADLSALTAIAPFPEWQRAGRTCISIDPVVFALIRHHHRQGEIGPKSAALSHAWRDLARKEPVQLLHSRACRSSLAWSLGDPPRRQILTAYPQIYPNHLGLHPLAPAAIRNAAEHYAHTSGWRWVQVLFWRPALWLLLTVGAALLTGLRAGRWRLLLCFLYVPLGVLVSYAASPAAQDARYTYAAVVICQLAVVAYVGSWVRGRASRERARRPLSPPAG